MLVQHAGSITIKDLQKGSSASPMIQCQAGAFLLYPGAAINSMCKMSVTAHTAKESVYHSCEVSAWASATGCGFGKVSRADNCKLVTMLSEVVQAVSRNYREKNDNLSLERKHSQSKALKQPMRVRG